MLTVPKRRLLLGAGAAAGAVAAPAAAGLAIRSAVGANHAAPASGHGGPHGAAGMAGDNAVVGTVDHARNGFDPHAILTDWDTGTIVTDPDGARVREWVLGGVSRTVLQSMTLPVLMSH